MNRRIILALLLALVLPLAQLGAAAHEVSHLRTGLPDSAAPALHCDVCVAVAAVTGGAAAPSLAAPTVATPAQERAAWQPALAPQPAAAAPFLSRAPPFLH